MLLGRAAVAAMAMAAVRNDPGVEPGVPRKLEDEEATQDAGQ